ncbi:MAG: pyridoxal kinase, partial [Tannerellaceae bacterium]|nr:pyridoxal kinase [Tannerellaceae bacterium]
GTGDIFASTLLAGLLNDFSLKESADIAVRYTAGSIMRTYEQKTDRRFGVDFEHGFPQLLKELKLT